MAKEISSPGLIQTKSIFGAYSQKENRVTAALLHLIERGGEDLLRAIFPDLPNSSISVKTQVSPDDVNAKKMIYDGVVSCDFSFKYIIESKVVRNRINITQLNNYRKQAKKDNSTLVYITPYDVKPKVLNNEVWYNWATIADNLKNYENEDELLQYLIEQFILLLENLGLYEDWKGRVLIVGGSWGEKVALRFNLYACQNNRFFKKCEYLAFAFDHKIKTVFKIMDGSPTMNQDLRQLPQLQGTDFFTNYFPNYNGDPHQVFLLEKDNLFSTRSPIINDKRTVYGKRVAFTQNQTYTTYERMKTAQYTSEL